MIPFCHVHGSSYISRKQNERGREENVPLEFDFFKSFCNVYVPYVCREILNWIPDSVSWFHHMLLFRNCK
jgi:hypothetical protein